MLPYLHEKRIYLHEPDQEAKYFYTSKDSDFICMNESEFYYEVFSQRGLLRSKVDFKNIVLKYGLPIARSSNGLNYIFL